MKKFVITACLAIGLGQSVLPMFAQKISKEVAMEKAVTFLNKIDTSTSTARKAQRSPIQLELANSEDEFYIFNNENEGGFVIVSNDERVADILGYNTKGRYQAESIPPALEWWLKLMRREIQSVRQGANVLQLPQHAAIQPMIQTHWGQDEPYNLRMPNRGDGPTQYYFPGCVATAMAQVMYYNRCPEGMMATSIPDYLDQSLPPTSFNWDVMQPVYYDSRDEGIDEVCKLMFYCAASVEAQLSFWMTGAYPIDMTEALRRYFGFAETTHSVQRTSFSAEEWDQLIYHELEEGRVVLYSGESVSTEAYSAHMFICDGYDGNGLYHINWGWDGNSDGYFLLSVLNPDDEGVGGNQGSFGYSINQQATIGIQKAVTPVPFMTRAELGTIVVEGGTDGVRERSSSGHDFPPMTISPVLSNSVVPHINRSYDTAIGLYHGTERISVLEGDNQSNRKDIAIESNMSKTMTISNIRLGKGLADGDYKLKVLCRESGMEDWQEAINADDNYVKVHISGNQMAWNVYNGVYRENGEIKVNSAVIEGDLKMGEPLTFKVNVTNEGPHNNAALYLWCNSDANDLSQYHLVAGIGSGLDSGTSGELTLAYSPWRTGNHQFVLSNSPYTMRDEHHLYDLETDITQSERLVAMRLLYVEKTECDYEYQCDGWGYAPVMRMYPQYQKTGTFTCNFGLAICKDNQLVRRDYFWGGWTFVDWKVCTASISGSMFEGLEDGDYQISMDYQIGDGEWIPCIGSDTTFVEMKIDNGKAYFKNRFLNGEGFTVDAMNIEGKPRIKHKMNINVTATNNTPYPYHCVFLHVNDSVVGIRMFENMKTGTTETMPFTRTWWDSTYDFYASTSGPHIFSVVDGDGNAVITETVDITKPSPAKLVASDFHFTNTTGEYVYAPGLKLSATIYNNSEYLYDDDLRLQIQGIWSVFGNDTTFFTYSPNAYIPIVLQPHEQRTFEMEPAYNFYETDKLTRANVYYFSEEKEIVLSRTPFYLFTYDSTYNGITNVPSDAILDQDVYNLQGVKIGTVDQLGHLPNGIYITNNRRIIKRR